MTASALSHPYCIETRNLTRTFKNVTAVKNLNLQMPYQSVYGFLGPNGAGKTTTIRMILGLIKPDQGSVHFTPSRLRVGYLPQGAIFEPSETLDGYLRRCAGDMPALTQRLEELALALVSPIDQPALQTEYDATLAQIEMASESQGRGPVVRANLGLAELPGDLPVSALSERSSALRSASASTEKLTTCPRACTPASVRPAPVVWTGVRSAVASAVSISP